jgi:hypothetical protein
MPWNECGDSFCLHGYEATYYLSTTVVETCLYKKSKNDNRSNGGFANVMERYTISLDEEIQHLTLQIQGRGTQLVWTKKYNI